MNGLFRNLVPFGLWFWNIIDIRSACVEERMIYNAVSLYRPMGGMQAAEGYLIL
jgi:hypothetical protein